MGTAACLVRGGQAFDVGQPKEGLKLVSKDRSVHGWHFLSPAGSWLLSLLQDNACKMMASHVLAKSLVVAGGHLGWLVGFLITGLSEL